MNDRFWENLEIIVMEKGLSWADLARQMFKGQYVYPSEFRRSKDLSSEKSKSGFLS